MPSVSEAKLGKKEKEALAKVAKQLAALGKGVTSEAQQIFDCLAKT
jgi:hypothetical protein